MTVKEAFIVPPGITVGKDGEKQIVSEFISVKTTMDYFSRPMFEKTHSLCMFQGTRINTAIDVLLEDLYKGMDLPNVAFKIRMDNGL